MIRLWRTLSSDHQFVPLAIADVVMLWTEQVRVGEKEYLGELGASPHFFVGILLLFVSETITRA